MQSQPLNASDFDVLENTLLKYGDDHSVLNPSELDGYFTALVSSPTQVDIGEWFPAIWGGQNPAWQTPEEAKQLAVRAVQFKKDVLCVFRDPCSGQRRLDRMPGTYQQRCPDRSFQCLQTLRQRRRTQTQTPGRFRDRAKLRDHQKTVQLEKCTVRCLRNR